MTKVKGFRKYIYNYPENEVLATYLRLRDITRIANATGYCPAHISAIFKGRRRMPVEVLDAFLELRPEARKHCKRVPIIPIKQTENTL